MRIAIFAFRFAALKITADLTRPADPDALPERSVISDPIDRF